MTQAAHIRPDNARKVAMKNGGATFYLFEDKAGRPCAHYYVGKARKAKRFYFPSEKSRAKHIEGVVSNIEARQKEKAGRQAERNKPHNLEKGLILYTSWGYDQTNVEYYEVIDVPSPCYVVLQEIGAPLARGEESFMSGHSVPNPEQKIGEPIRRKVDMAGGSPSVRINSCVIAWVWDGKERYSSWYA